MAHQTRFRAASNEGNAAVLIHAAGPCTMTCCASLKKFLSQFKKPVTASIFLDLSEAESIDSTFAGFLLSVATKKSDPKTPDLFLVRPSERILEAIRTMHIGGFLKTSMDWPGAAAEWREVAIEREECDALRETVIDAHENLIDVDERNAKQFGRVVEGLRTDRQNERPPP